MGGVHRLPKNETAGWKYLVKRALTPHVHRRHSLLILLIIATALAVNGASRVEPTVEELKAHISSANTADKVHLCVQVAEKQLAEANKLFAAADIENAQAALTDVVAYSELARDYSIQSHRHQKQTEISVRAMTRKLNGILHTLGRDEQAPIRDAISHLERVRDDLLASMFPKGAK